MSQTFKHIVKFFKKENDRIDKNMQKQFGKNWSNVFINESPKSVADLTKQYFDAGHL